MTTNEETQTEQLPENPHAQILDASIATAQLAREIFIRNIGFGITDTDSETVIKKSYMAASKFDKYTENFLSLVQEKFGAHDA
jgi:hypothetical protein